MQTRERVQTISEQLRGAAHSLDQLAHVVNESMTGARVTIPINDAAAAFGIDVSSLRAMKERRRTILVTFEDDRVVISLQGSPYERGEDYRYLYTLLQSRQIDRKAEILLKRGIPEGLARRIPRLVELARVVTGGRSMIPNEDWEELAIELYGQWLALGGRKSGLPDPENVFNARAY